MFSTCIFCNKALGANEAIESFPVGKRLAFDAARGRLWVVCPACERWNLSPLDERWTAIDDAERLYRDTRKRVSTDNIGLAKLRDGTTLVRIGEPMRPEFAAWRYGDQFGRRRTRAVLAAGAGITVLGGLVIGGAVAGVTIGSVGYGLTQVGSAIIRGRPNTVVAKILTEERGLVHVRRRHLSETWLSREPDGQLAIDLRFKNGSGHFTGREAERIASIVVPKVNRFGGSKTQVADAVGEIESLGGSEAFLNHIGDSLRVVRHSVQRAPRRRWQFDNGKIKPHGLFALPRYQGLALEMALHEEAERRAMQGELAELEQVWREAEEIAAIADELTLPESVETALQRMKLERDAARAEPRQVSDSTPASSPMSTRSPRRH